jgi:multisubunit Na+/H+ antiporter MnhG subunit
MQWFGVIFAVLGAGMILFALTYVTLLVGAIVNAMVVLMSGPLIDRLVARKR